LDLQTDALKKAGCEKIITDEVNGSVADRLSLVKLKEILRHVEMLLIWRLDWLSRIHKHPIEWVNELEQYLVIKFSLVVNQKLKISN